MHSCDESMPHLMKLNCMIITKSYQCESPFTPTIMCCDRHITPGCSIKATTQSSNTFRRLPVLALPTSAPLCLHTSLNFTITYCSSSQHPHTSLDDAPGTCVVVAIP